MSLEYKLSDMDWWGKGIMDQSVLKGRKQMKKTEITREAKIEALRESIAHWKQKEKHVQISDYRRFILKGIYELGSGNCRLCILLGYPNDRDCKTFCPLVSCGDASFYARVTRAFEGDSLSDVFAAMTSMIGYMEEKLAELEAEAKPEPVTYSRGDRFNAHGVVYMLCAAYHDNVKQTTFVILAQLETGMRWSEACQVNDSHRITEAELAKICHGHVSDFTKIEKENPND